MDNQDIPKKLKKKKVELDTPQYILDAKRAGKKAQASRVKTHATNIPKVLGVRGLRPDIAYRWVDKSGSNVGIRESQGYAVIKDDSLIGPRHSGGSTIDTHDSILMGTTIDNQKELQAIPGKRSRDRVKGAMSNAHLEKMRETEITKKTYENALQAHKENTNIFE